MSAPEVRTSKRGRWTRVYLEAEDRDVSHLNYGPFVLPLGRHGSARMAGIGGVGTDPEYRRRGLARRVFSRAMEEIRAAGYSCVGLHTGTNIVAHRLYRRFGFVDIVVHEPAVKLLDPAAFLARCVTRGLGRAAERAPEIGDWCCHLTVALPDEPPLRLRIEAGRAEVLTSAPPRADLAVTGSRGALIRVCMGTITPRFAEIGGLLRWQGPPEHWQRLSMAIAAQYPVIDEGTE